MKKVLFEYSFIDYKTTFCRDHNLITELDSDSKNYYRQSKWKFFSPQSHSTKKEDFENNFKNQSCSQYRDKLLLLVEKESNKIRLKIYRNTYVRIAGRPYSKRKTLCKYFTVNVETGDFYEGKVEDYHKKRGFKKTIKKNSVYSRPFASILVEVKNLLTKQNPELQKIVHRVKQTFLSELGLNANSHIDDAILEFYLKKKGIKYPNNFSAFYYNFNNRLKLSFLRKNGMKLVDSFMKFHNLKGDVIRKCLHTADKIDPVSLKSALEYFPQSWILQDEDFVRKILGMDYFGFNWCTEDLIYFKENSSNKEFYNFFQCYRISILNSAIGFSSLIDHVGFFKYLKEVGENIKWKSNSSSDFQTEHLDWADKFEFYKKGRYDRIYPQSIYDIVGDTLIHNQDLYFPVVLKNSSEYNEESFLQSNCVRTYIGRPSSIIISIRKNSKNSDERATVEYQIFKQENKINFVRPQSLGRYNQRLSEEWNPVLKKLDEKMKKWIEKDEEFVTVKLEKTLENLDKKLYSDTDWSENGFLFWTYNLITKDDVSFYDIPHLLL